MLERFVDELNVDFSNASTVNACVLLQLFFQTELAGLWRTILLSEVSGRSFLKLNGSYSET